MNLFIAAKEAYLNEQEEVKRKQEAKLANDLFRMFGKEYMDQFTIDGNRADIRGMDYYLYSFINDGYLTLSHKTVDGILGYPVYSLSSLWSAYQEAGEKLKKRKTFWGWLAHKMGFF
jgi:hypothetical protein